MQWYTIWTAHGEKMPEEKIETSTRNVGDGDDDMYHDADDMLRDIGEANRYFENVDDEPNPAAKEFYKMLHSASEPIYPSNVNYTTFEFVNELLHFKNKHNCSNNGFDDLLKLIGSVLPDNHKLPQTYYANDCMLFYKENSEKTRCDICKESRYKEPKDLNKKQIPRKILRYFPLTPRLQRLFMAGKTAKCMRWHHDRNVVEGELSHPADGDEWKQFDRSGWSTKGKLSCPVCMGEVKAKQLKYGGKVTFYDTSRYFLEPDDPLRRSTRFGSVETRSCTCRHSGIIAKTMFGTCGLWSSLVCKSEIINVATASTCQESCNTF
ncbi:hypothetical protein DCAR_0936128 [Daucus carota subsp. sativus]|uniref:Transposase-associated domain-containing protein n=1 Tax=Daucus carota subsp. sativus TaxID=79200 RepID=A0AAF0Y117_DAUCS|nr:hypothetical protein DCAR_0936128 [Daucus carota subsp. sativus]